MADGTEPDGRPDGDREAPARPTHQPVRPGFASGLPQREVGPRPRVAAVVAALVAASIACFLAPTVVAALRHRSLRTDLQARLAERAPDYSAEDIDRAVLLGLAVVLVATLGACLLQLLAARAILARRRSGRSSLLVATLLLVPLSVLASAFRDGGTTDAALLVGQGAFALTALVLSRSSQLVEWLEARPAFAIRPLISDSTSAED